MQGPPAVGTIFDDVVIANFTTSFARKTAVKTPSRAGKPDYQHLKTPTNSIDYGTPPNGEAQIQLYVLAQDLVEGASRIHSRHIHTTAYDISLRILLRTAFMIFLLLICFI